jgi:hypothetical protein
MQRPARDNEARGTKDTFFKGASSVVVAPNGDIFVVDGHGLLHCMSPEMADFVAKVENWRVIILPSEDETIRNRRFV